MELFRERVILPAELSYSDAETAVEDKEVSRLLKGARGFKPDAEKLAQTLHRFGLIAQAIAPYVAEVDINPVVVNGSDAVAVDALIVRS